MPDFIAHAEVVLEAEIKAEEKHLEQLKKNELQCQLFWNNKKYLSEYEEGEISLALALQKRAKKQKLLLKKRR